MLYILQYILYSISIYVDPIYNYPGTCREIAVATSNGSINFWDYKAGPKGRPKKHMRHQLLALYRCLQLGSDHSIHI